MIESAALAARIQASELFPGFSIPEGPSLWAEAMNWACDAYNRTATVANPGNRSPYEMFYGEPPKMSPIPFLKPGFCKHKRKTKMDPKARECFYLSPARNHPSESKRVLVHSRKVIVTRNVTWAHVAPVRPMTAQSKPSAEGEGDDWVEDREASSVDDGVESLMSSSSSEDSSRDQKPPRITSGRAASEPDAGGLSSLSRVSLDTEGGELSSAPSCGEGLANSSASSAVNGSSGLSSGSNMDAAGVQPAVLPAAESRRLAEYIPGPQRPTILAGHTRGDERRRQAKAPLGLVSIEDELEIALCAEEEAIPEEALLVDRDASVEMPSGKVKDLPLPPTTQAEVLRSPYRKAFEHSQTIELNGLMDVGCFEFVDKKDIPRGER